MITAIVGGALAIAAWHLLVGGTRNVVARVGVTVNAILVGSALILLTPTSSATVGVGLHWLSGMWNLEDLFSHNLLLIAAGLTCARLAGRLSGAGVARAFYLWVETPVTLTIPVLVWLFLMGRAKNVYYVDLFRLVDGAWMTAYWVVLSVVLAWLLIYSAAAAVVLNKSLPVAYLTAAGTGVGACLTQLVMALTSNSLSVVVWVLACVSVVTFAVGAGRDPVGNSPQ